MSRLTQPEFMRLLDPAALAKVHQLDLVARGVVEGLVTGRHRSPHKGMSVEFAEHRQYVAGDDTRMLDWRVLGRSDRYVVKQFVEETNLRATILLDASASMDYTGQHAAEHEGQPLSKLDYGRFLAATVAHLLSGQQDAVGLATFGADLRRYIPPRSRTSHLRAILQELAVTEPDGPTRLAPVLNDLAERVGRRGLVVLISDLFEDTAALVEAIHHFRFRGHEVLVFHVLAEEELTFPFEAVCRFVDAESVDPAMQLDPRAIRAEYLDRVREHVDTLREGCGQLRVDYVPMCTAEPFDEALTGYLGRRSRR